MTGPEGNETDKSGRGAGDDSNDKRQSEGRDDRSKSDEADSQRKGNERSRSRRRNDDGASRSGDDDFEVDRRRDSSRHRKHKRKTSSSRKSSHRKSGRKYSDESDSESYDSDSSRNSDDSRGGRKKHRRKRHKKRKNHRRSRDDSSSSHDSEGRSLKRSRKDKKKNKKDRKSSESGSSNKPPQDDGIPTFGKYGILKSSDFHKEQTQRSFTVWMEEVKGVPSFSGPKWELQEYYKEYMEDFNTATLPHMKYYNYDKWEMEEYQKNKAKAMSDASSSVQKDELLHREAMLKKAQAKRKEEENFALSLMNKEKVEEMKHKAKLQAEMAHAYKTGDQDTYQRLKSRMEPEQR